MGAKVFEKMKPIAMNYIENKHGKSEGLMLTNQLFQRTVLESMGSVFSKSMLKGRGQAVKLHLPGKVNSLAR